MKNYKINKMEKEMNYLSEKIDKLETSIDKGSKIALYGTTFKDSDSEASIIE